MSRHAAVLEHDVKAAEAKSEALDAELAELRLRWDGAVRVAADERNQANNVGAQLRETVAANQHVLRYLHDALEAAGLSADDGGNLAGAVQELVNAQNRHNEVVLPPSSVEAQIATEDHQGILLELGRPGEDLARCTRRIARERDEWRETLAHAAKGFLPEGADFEPQAYVNAIRNAVTFASGQADRRLAESLVDLRKGCEHFADMTRALLAPAYGVPGAAADILRAIVAEIDAVNKPVTVPGSGGNGGHGGFPPCAQQTVVLPTLRVVSSWPLPWPRLRYVETLTRVRGEIEGTVRQFAARKDPDDHKWAALLEVQSQTLEALSLTFGNGGAA